MLECDISYIQRQNHLCNQVFSYRSCEKFDFLKARNPHRRGDIHLMSRILRILAQANKKLRNYELLLK